MAIRQTTEDFEPPKYIASLIAAANDGAKSAQAGAVLFLAVGLYLLATAFSATDADLLPGRRCAKTRIPPARWRMRSSLAGMRCRQLLANVEFIVVLTAPQGSPLYSRFWPWLFRGIVAVFPVDLIVNVQRATLALDLVVLVWFFRRNALDGSAWPERRPASPDFSYYPEIGVIVQFYESHQILGAHAR